MARFMKRETVRMAAAVRHTGAAAAFEPRADGAASLRACPGPARRSLLKFLAGALPLLPASAAALIAFAFLAGALPASAQSSVLVSNVGQTDGGTGGLATYDHAQAFTTGSNAAGYTLTGVEVEFAGVARVASYAVGIWSSDEEEDSSADTDTDHEPHAKLGDLTCPALSQSTDDAVYDCTTTGIDLEADKTYLFVVDSSDDADNYLRNTASDSEDANAASGWSIANTSRFRPRANTGNWVVWNESRKIRISGTAKTSGTNTAPTASNNTVTTAEDTAYTFRASDFNFSDTDTGDTLASVKIVTLPDSGKGILAVSGTAVTANQVVTAANIANLTYTPPDGESGTGFASFTFKVSDGTDESTAAYTMTVNVTAAPPPVSANVLVSNVGQSRAGTVTLQNSDAAQAFTTGHDPAGYTLTGVEVRFDAVADTSATYDVDIWSSDEEVDSGADSDSRHEPHEKLADLTCGALAVGNVACTAAGTGFDLAATTTYLLVIDSSSIAVNRIGFTNSGNEDAGGLLGWSIEDTGLFRSRTSTGGWTQSSASRMIRVNGAAKSSGANTAPTAANRTVTTVVDRTYTFSASDFNFSDTDTGDTLASVRITTVESAGDLELDGRDVTRNQVIGRAAIDDGELTFAPAAGATGDPYATFQFKVSDGTAESASAYTMTVVVSAAPPRAPTSSVRVTPRLTGVAVQGTGSGRFRLSWDKLPAGVKSVKFSIGLGVNSNPNHWVLRERPDGGYSTVETHNQTFWEKSTQRSTAGQSFTVPEGSSPTSATFPCSTVEDATHPGVRYRRNFDYGQISPHLYLLLRARAVFRDGRFEPWTYPVYFRGCGIDPGSQMTSRFLNPDEPHDGSTPFDARLELSLEPASGFSYRVFQGDRHRGRPSVLQVTNGTVQRARRDGTGQNRKWLITIVPTSDEAVTITLPATTDCNDVNAICTADGRMLSEAVTKVVPGPAAAGSQPESEERADLTVAYTMAPPAEHDGQSAFSFAFSFSENLHADYSYKTMRDRSLTVMQGGTRLTPVVKRKVPGGGNNHAWIVTVTPDGHGDIAIALPATPDCDAAGALCTGDERGLSAGLPSRVVQGPPGLSVADARVEEAAGATVDFAVTLSRAAAAPVTVDYATSDGTAVAGSDYTATSGTLTFAAGETEKTVSVPVLDDTHDDGGETFTLTLSNPVGGHAYVAEGSATGTIENSDPMPQAWLARFGRTVGTHVTDAVSARFRGGAAASHVTVGGYRLPLTRRPPGAPATGLHARAPGGSEPGAGEPLKTARLRGLAAGTADAGPRLGRIGPQALASGGSGPGAGEAPPGATERDTVTAVLAEVARVLGMGTGGAGPGPEDRESDAGVRWDPRLGQSRTLDVGQTLGQTFDLRRLLLGSAFRLNLNQADAGAGVPRLTAWGRVAGTTFDGREDDLALDGDVLTGTVGVDGAWDRVLLGLAVAHSRGDGGYTMAGQDALGQGDLETTLTSLHPYLRYAVTDRLDVWGVLGYGWGELDLDLADATLETDTTFMMGAFGSRGILLAPADTGGFQLATRTDAMLTRTSSDAVTGATGNLAASDGDAHRVRVILEGSRGVTWADGRTLTPTVEVGLRHDWGDAETGFGVEVGGRVQYADPRLGLTIEGAVRGLLAHEDEDYQEWGASGSLRLAPGAGGQGLAVTLAPTWGAAASGVNQLWARQTTQDLAPQGTRQTQTGQLAADVGYGVALFDTGLLTPYAGTVLAEGANRTYRLGTRWQGVTGLTLNLEGTRQEPAGPQRVNQGVRFQVGWGF